MIHKIFTIVLLTACLSKTSYSSANITLLDMEIDTWSSKVWRGDVNDKSDIKGSINFIYSLDTIDKKYLDITSFKEFYKKSRDEVKEISDLSKNHFPQFVSLCKKAYKEMNDDKFRVGIYMLLEGVTKRHLEYVRRAKSLNVERESKDVFLSSNFSDSFDLLNKFFDRSPNSSPKVNYVFYKV